MAQKRDYYEVLGVAKDATADQIKSAYRKLAMKYHPDRNPGDKAAEEKFKEAAEAYDVLHDPEKRQRYDQFGHQAFDGGVGGGYGAGGMSMDDIFAAFGDLFGGHGGGGGFGGFEEFFGGGRQRRVDPNAPRRGDDMTFRINIDFDEAVFGSERTIDLQLPRECEECHGTGSADGKRTMCKECRGTGTKEVRSGLFQVRQTCRACGGEGTVIEKPCRKCHGSGQQPKTEHITLKIPAGVDTGSRLRLAGKGAGGLRGGENGDLYVHLQVGESDIFERDGLNLYVDVPVSPVDAALGCTVEVPTPDGLAELKLPAGTPNGKILRLRGKGIASLRGLGRGDLDVRIVFEVPVDLDRKQKAALEDFNKRIKPGNFPELARLKQRMNVFFSHKEKLQPKK